MLHHRSLIFAAALVAALGGQALASGHNLPVAGLHGSPPPEGHKSYTAVVNADGALVRGSGATGATLAEGAGTYEVDFEADVTACAYVATLGQTGGKGIAPPGGITVVGRSGVPNGIFVETADLTGQLTNRSFQVDVGC